MFEDSISDWLRTFWSVITGFVAAILGYFLPVKNIVHLLVLVFILDVLFGYCAARKLRGERFSMKIIWRTTFPRIGISLVLILLAFLWDTVYQQNMVATYRIIGWFITGVLLANIIQNGYRITHWDMFLGLGDVLKNKLREKTGVDIKTKNENTD
jgi:hypothetical protein